jgi:hypothetical protein
MFVSRKFLLAASAWLLAGFPAFGTGETPVVAPVAGPTAVVKCPGVTNITFTADQVQALPLQVVGSLSCGETVAVLSDDEGYTARIRTRDGQEGYVARMYLAARAEALAPALVKQAAPVVVAVPVNGVVRWETGAPGCDEFLSHGRHVESITTSGITVQVSLQDSTWKYRVNVAISNHGEPNVAVLPEMVTLDELQPDLRPLPAASLQEVVHSPTHQVMWTFADAVPSPSAVAFPTVTTSPASMLEHNTSPTPDYLDPHMTLAFEQHGAYARNESIDVEAIALKPGPLPPGQKTAGVVWFERDSGARELSLRVPVGEVVFDFAFSLEQKK